MQAPDETAAGREQLNVVIVGHVDHGKSTVIGRLLADTGALPEGKLEQVRRTCAASAKPFEYAFLLDALKDEQAQGITIDAARCFFKTTARDYIIIDAPGHIEFLKNMITGASRAEAALLVIDAKEGIRENSRRHGFLLSMLGIRQLVVLVNKMDLVDYDEAVFEQVKADFAAFLAEVGTRPSAFVPIAAMLGDNLTAPSERMPWYGGPTVLEVIDGFDGQPPPTLCSFRMPVQDVYKFTEAGDERRIIAGTVVAGQARVGQEIVFHPSGKRSVIRSVEGFSRPPTDRLETGQATGVTLETQVYVRPGEMMCLASEPAPAIATRLRASIFWLGRKPLVRGRRYKLKLGNAATSALLRHVHRVIDASDLAASTSRDQVDRHEVADCVLETVRPIAFDLGSGAKETGRFVLVDEYEIAGGGIVTGIPPAAPARTPEGRDGAIPGSVTATERCERYRQRPKLVLLTGADASRLPPVAVAVERQLFAAGRYVYFAPVRRLAEGLGADLAAQRDARDEAVRRLGELAALFADAGCILIAVDAELDEAELDRLRALAAPSEVLLVGLGSERIDEVRLALDAPADCESAELARQICELLIEKRVVEDYQI